MATPKTVTGVATLPDGTTIASCSVQAVLSQACLIPGTSEIIPEPIETRTANGAFSLTLYANADLTPTGTYYTVTYELQGRVVNTLIIQVPNTAGPFVISNLITSTPTASPTPNHVSTLTVDGAAAAGTLALTSAAPVVAAGSVGLGSTTATSATAGANGDVPAQVDGYLLINVGGIVKKVPYYPN
jgi:hypothetical protein